MYLFLSLLPPRFPSVADDSEPQYSGDGAQRGALPACQPRILSHTQPGNHYYYQTHTRAKTTFDDCQQMLEYLGMYPSPTAA